MEENRYLYAYRAAMNDIPLNPQTSALLIVDLQNASADPNLGWVPAMEAAGHGEIMHSYLERVNETVLPNVRRLQEAFRDVGAPVIFLTVGTIVGDFSDMAPRFQRSLRFWEQQGIPAPYSKNGTPEMAVLEAIAPQPGEPVITKTGYSGFTSSPLESVLHSRNVRELAVCGVATEACVESTLRAAVDRGFDCVLVEDACASMTEEARLRAVESMALFARIATSLEVAEEIAGPSGTPTV